MNSSMTGRRAKDTGLRVKVMHRTGKTDTGRNTGFLSMTPGFSPAKVVIVVALVLAAIFFLTLALGILQYIPDGKAITEIRI